MKNTWNVIDEQIQMSHKQVDKVMQQKSMSQLWQQNKKAIITASLGLMMVSITFFGEPNSFLASVFKLPNADSEKTEKVINKEPDFQAEAADVDIKPLSKNIESSTENPFLLPNKDIKKDNINNDQLDNKKVSNDPFFDISDLPDEMKEDLIELENIENEAVQNFNNEKTEEKKEEINPFLSLENKEVDKTFVNKSMKETEIKAEKETLHAAASNQLSTQNKNEVFKVNPHVNYDQDLKVNTKLQDPLLQNIKSNLDYRQENFHEATNIVPVNGNMTNSYTGILLASIRPEDSQYPFRFALQLSNDEKLQIDTNRDLRSVIGSEVSIDIEGTKENFILKNVHYEKPTQILVHSGPASILFATLLITLGLTIFFRRSFKLI